MTSKVTPPRQRTRTFADENDAPRIRAEMRAEGFEPVTARWAVAIEPANGDPFVWVFEERA